MRLGPVTPGCRERLTAHYGQSVTIWLDRVPDLFGAAAGAWDLRLLGYHDAGHAAALALATTSAGTPAMLKAWFDHDRYRRETAALRHWEPINGRVVRVQDPDSAVAWLQLVGGTPGGGPRPADDYRPIAQALARLHGQPLPGSEFLSLDAYLYEEVETRIRRRVDEFGDPIGLHFIDLGLHALEQRMPTGPAVLLHADLYQENVPFGHDGVPVFLDPLPMIGTQAFDWAFFVVYFDLTRDAVPRLRIAAEVSGISIAVLLPWCLLLCLDGLLYYHEVRDDRKLRMIEVMAALAAGGGLT